MPSVRNLACVVICIVMVTPGAAAVVECTDACLSPLSPGRNCSYDEQCLSGRCRGNNCCRTHDEDCERCVPEDGRCLRPIGSVCLINSDCASSSCVVDVANRARWWCCKSSNCAKTDSHGNCQECVAGFYGANLNKCLPQKQYGSSCNNNAQCEKGECVVGRCLRSSGLRCSFDSECASNNCVISSKDRTRYCCKSSNCAVTLQNGNCYECAPDFFLTNANSCLRKARKIAPGSYCSHSTECQYGQCAGNYCCNTSTNQDCEVCTPYNGDCMKKPGSTCIRSDQCTSNRCGSGHCCALEAAGHCKTCGSVDGTCKKCEMLYHLSQGRCVLFLPEWVIIAICALVGITLCVLLSIAIASCRRRNTLRIEPTETVHHAVESGLKPQPVQPIESSPCGPVKLPEPPDPEPDSGIIVKIPAMTTTGASGASQYVKATPSQKEELEKLLAKRKEICDYLSAVENAFSAVQATSHQRSAHRMANAMGLHKELKGALYDNHLDPSSYSLPQPALPSAQPISPLPEEESQVDHPHTAVDLNSSQSESNDDDAELHRTNITESRPDIATYLAQLESSMAKVQPLLSQLKESLNPVGEFSLQPYNHIGGATALHGTGADGAAVCARQFKLSDARGVKRLIKGMRNPGSPFLFLQCDTSFLYVLTSQPDLEMWLDNNKTSPRPARYLMRKVIMKALTALTEFHRDKGRPHGAIDICSFYVSESPGFVVPRCFDVSTCIEAGFEVQLYGSRRQSSSMPQDLQMVGSVIEVLASKVQWTPELKRPLDDLIRRLHEGEYSDAKVAAQVFFTASDVPVLDTRMREEREDVTATHKDAVQYIIDKSCCREKLARGRDQRHRGSYDYLVVVKVEKVRNTVTWNSYQTTRAAMSQDYHYPVPEYYENLSTKAAKECCPNGNLYDIVNEGLFWHGTEAKNVNDIVKSSFMREHSAEGALGRCIYFAQDCSKSDQYSSPDDHALYPFFLARVCMGSVFHTDHPDSSMTHPPKIGPTGKLFHESVSGPVNKLEHIESVIYKNSQAYPAYIVWCCRTKINSWPTYDSAPEARDLF